MPTFLTTAGLALLVLGAGGLRALGPVPGLLPSWNHPLGLALLLVFVVWVGARSDGRRLPGLPLMAALLAEGWIRIALLNPAFEAWVAPHFEGRVADSVYHLLGAVWLIGVALLVVRHARVKLGGLLSLQSWKHGLYTHTLSLLLVYGFLGFLLQSTGGFRGLSLQVPIYPPVALWALAGQGALCLGEEIFYRGFLGGALTAALSPGRVAASRPAPLAAWLSSSLFALDHLKGMNWGTPLVMTFLYTLALGLLLSMLVSLTGRLALATLAHLFHNLMILRLGLSVSDLGGFVWFEAMTYISLYFILTFSLLFAIRRPAWEPLRRALAGAR